MPSGTDRRTAISKVDYADQAYARGYVAPREAKAAIIAAHTTKPILTCVCAVFDGLSICVATLALPAAVSRLPLFAVPVTALVAIVFMARQMRGQECLMHEASHYNWWRRHRTANDLLAFALVGIPTGTRVEQYRFGHTKHHARFATRLDPDRRRYVELDLESLDREHTLVFLSGMLTRLWRYQRGWLRFIGNDPVLIGMRAAWAFLTLILPAYFIYGSAGVALAASTWIPATGIALPVIRFIGEADEHVYISADTIFDATISNIGLFQRWIIHPHNDGYHTIHHMWPGVPHHALPNLHRYLTETDSSGYARNLRYRTRVLAAPTVAARSTS